MTDIGELRIVVSIINEASAQLKKIKTDMAEVNAETQKTLVTNTSAVSSNKQLADEYSRLEKTAMGYGKELKSMSPDLAAVQARVEPLSKSLEKTGTASGSAMVFTSELSARFAKLAEAARKPGPEVDNLIKEFNSLDPTKQAASFSTFSKILKNEVVEDIRKTSKVIGDELPAALEKNKGPIEAFLGHMTKVRWAMVNAFLIFNIAKFGWSSILAPAIEYGMKIEQISMLTGKSTKAIENQMKSLREGTIYSLKDVSEGFIEVTKRGFDFGESAKVINAATKLAQVGFVDMKVAVDALTTTLNQFFMGADKANQIASYLAYTANKSAADVEQLQEALSYVGPVAFSMGMGIEEVLSILGKLHDVGIRGSTAGTSMRQALISLSDPADRAAKYIENLGVTLFDTKGDFVGLTSVIEQLAFVFSKSGMEEEAKALATVFETRTATSIVSLIEAEKQLPGAIRIATGEIEKQKTAVDNLQGSLSGYGIYLKEQQQGLSAAWDSFTIAVGKGVGAYMGLLMAYGTANQTFREMDKAIKNNELTWEEYHALMKEQTDLQKESGLLDYEQMRGWQDKVYAIMDLNGAFKAGIIDQDYYISESKKLSEATLENANSLRIESKAYIDDILAKRLAAKASKEVTENVSNEVLAAQSLRVALNAQNAAQKNLVDGLLKGTDSLDEQIAKLDEEESKLLDLIKVSYTKANVDLLGNETYKKTIELVKTSYIEKRKLADTNAKLAVEEKKLSDTEDEWNKKINANAKELAGVRKEIEAYNELISTSESRISALSDQRFGGETIILGLLDKVDIWMKKQKLLELGIADAGAFINQQLNRVGDSFDDLIAQQETVIENSNESADAYEAWKTTIETAIKAEVAAGESLNADVTDRVKTWQTALLSIQNLDMKGEGTSGQEKYLNKLQLAYDVYYGDMHNNVKTFLMEEEDKKNGVAASSAEVIGNIRIESDLIALNTVKLNEKLNKEKELVVVDSELRDSMDKALKPIQSQIDIYDSLAKSIQDVIDKKIEEAKTLKGEALEESKSILVSASEMAKGGIPMSVSFAEKYKQAQEEMASGSIQGTVFENYKPPTNNIPNIYNGPVYYGTPHGQTVVPSQFQEFGDFISRSGQPTMKISPQDVLVGTKNGKGMGNNINVTVNVSGSNVSANEIARQIRKELQSY